jgi:CRISPR-associated protein Cmr4
MYKQKSTLFMLCETPLHAGSGDDLGIVDLPIQRERHTSFPKVESSSLKGALREAFENAHDKSNNKDFQMAIHRTFGFDEKGKFAEATQNSFGKDNTQYSGSLAFTDARLLLFPVKSMKGVFVWLTCPQVLNKFAADMAITGTPFSTLGQLQSIPITDGNALVASDKPMVNTVVVLEEYAFNATVNNAVRDFAVELSTIVFGDNDLTYWKGLLQNNLVVLSDNDFRDFTLMSTEVITRTKIDNETGTVQDGALFTEEFLPNDSVLYSLVFASDEYGKNRKTEDANWVMDFFQKEIDTMGFFQLGGNATLGKGIIRTQLKKGGQNG